MFNFKIQKNMKKQLFSFVMTAVLAYFLSADLYAFSGTGSGTPEVPYVITSAAQLAEIKIDLSAHYLLGNDIDLTDWIAANSSTAGWEPIGFSGSNDVTVATPFLGTFDGGGHTISGLWIDRPDNKFVGLFGQIGGETTFKNLSIIIPEGKSIKGNENVGAVGGWFTNYINPGSNATTISNVFVHGKIEGTKCVGALVGLLNWTNATIENCYASGEIVSSGDGAGGLVGSSWGNLYLSIRYSYTLNSVTGAAASGGIFGAASANSAGGINVDISNCIAANPTVDGGTVHRILAYAKSGAILTFDNRAFENTLLNSQPEWWGTSDNNDGADITEAELKLQNTYAAWDFETIWQMGNGDYQLPTLKTLSLASQPTSNPAHLGGTSGIKYISTDNPDIQYANGILTIPNKSQNSTVEIYNSIGSLIITGTKSVYDLSSYARGVYLVKTGNRVVKILK
jgi:hypothetical protein